MGKHFGELMRLRGIITFKLSPHEQKAFAGAISQGFPNTIRRIVTEAPFLVIPLGICYMVYDQTEKKHAQLLRKNPAEFANDK